jgi:hypothetical protein
MRPGTRPQRTGTRHQGCGLGSNSLKERILGHQLGEKREVAVVRKHSRRLEIPAAAQ